MGQPNSKNSYFDANYNPMTKAPTNDSQNKSGTDVNNSKGDGDVNGDGSTSNKEENSEGTKENAAPAKKVDIDAKKNKFMKKWQPYMSTMVNYLKDELKPIIENFKNVTNTFNNKQTKILVSPDDKAFIEKKIITTLDDIKNFVKGSGDYKKDFIEYVDKVLLMNPEVYKVAKQSSYYETTHLINSNAFQLKNSIHYREAEDVLLSVIAATKAAKRHHELLGVLNYVKDSNTFKDILEGKEGKKEEGKEGKEEGEKEEGKDEGKDEGEEGKKEGEEGKKEGEEGKKEGEEVEKEGKEGGENILPVSYYGGSFDEGGGDYNDEGGGLFKSPEEKLAGKESDDKKKDIKEKKEQFFKDMIAVYKFIDANKDDLLDMYELKKIKDNVNKDSPKKAVIAKSLFDTITNYKPVEETTGAAIQGILGKKEDEGEGEGTPAEKKEGESEGAPAEKKEGESEGADKKGGAKPQSGGGRTKRVKRKKKFTRKKSRGINISINVEN